jgi:hypothetical protein
MRTKKARWWDPAGGETGIPHCLAEVHDYGKQHFATFYNKQVKLTLSGILSNKKIQE